jgi:cholesterol oxidase
MNAISSPRDALKSKYEVAVIGSGYGGGIAAARLARAGRQVAVFERGREILPGQYPTHTSAFLEEVQVDLPSGHLGSSTALFDFRLNAEMNVVVGCGLGGTSLINANIALRPEPRVFADPVWPQEIRAAAAQRGLDRYFERASFMLGSTPYPANQPVSLKMRAFTHAAEGLGARATRLPINVTFHTGPNAAGVQQNACVGCGDCVSGCNYAAKNTVLMNYLPDAKSQGAEIFTHMRLRRLARAGSGWRLYFDDDVQLETEIVVLACGTLGSTEVLLRSAAHGLSISKQLGQRFSGNGDMIGLTYNAEKPINAIGFGASDAAELTPVGPCSTLMLDDRNQPVLEDGRVMMDSAIPGALATFLPEALAVGLRVVGERGARDLSGWVHAERRELKGSLLGTQAGAVHNTLNYLVISHDASPGQLYLEDDRLRVAWPADGGREARVARAAELIERASKALNGDYIPNPVWNRLTDQQLVSGHPLGGCAMAETAERGVCDHKGRVFAAHDGTEVHAGLYVMDGAVVPRSLGANPLLAISALAERSVELLIEDRGWGSSEA